MLRAPRGPLAGARDGHPRRGCRLDAQSQPPPASRAHVIPPPFPRDVTGAARVRGRRGRARRGTWQHAAALLRHSCRVGRRHGLRDRRRAAAPRELGSSTGCGPERCAAPRGSGKRRPVAPSSCQLGARPPRPTPPTPSRAPTPTRATPPACSCWTSLPHPSLHHPLPFSAPAQGADPNARNAAGLQPLDLACAWPGKPPPGPRAPGGARFRAPPVKASCVPLHALLVSHGAVHGARFRRVCARVCVRVCLGRLGGSVWAARVRAGCLSRRGGLAPSFLFAPPEHTTTAGAPTPAPSSPRAGSSRTRSAARACHKSSSAPKALAASTASARIRGATPRAPPPRPRRRALAQRPAPPRTAATAAAAASGGDAARSPAGVLAIAGAGAGACTWQNVPSVPARLL